MVLGNTLNILRPPGVATQPIQTGWNEELVKNMHKVLGELAQQISSQTFGGFPQGTSRPSGVTANVFWLDTTTATNPVLKMFDGTDDITVMTFDYGANTVSFGSLTNYATKVILEAATVPVVVTAIQLTGYTTDGDGGGALYKRVGGEPSHALKVQSADGAWWEIVPEIGGVSPLQAGAVGDGTTDDVSALNDVFDFGGTIRFTHDKTYAFSTQIEIHDDTELIGTARFKLKTTIADAVAAILINANCEIERLELVINTSVTIRRAINFVGAGTTAGFISLISVDQQNNRTTTLDAGIKVSGADVEINGVYVENFDNGLSIESTTGVILGPITVNTYVRGIKFNLCSDITIGQFRAHTASANASDDPGNNGILIEECSQMSFDDIFIADAGEHGFRIGGNEGEIGCQYLNFSSVYTLKSGQCGVKVNDSSELTRAISFGTITAIDSASAGAPGSNEDGLRLEKCKDINIGTLFVGRLLEADSAFDGIYMAGVTRIHIGSAYITNVLNHGVEIVDTVGGITGVTDRPNASIHFGSLFVEAAGVDGININHSDENMGHFTVLDGYMRNIIGDVLQITTSAGSGSGGVPNPICFNIKYDLAGAGLNTASTAGRIFANLVNLDLAKLTIASGVITVSAELHDVDVESGTDDFLDTINGGVNGKRIVLRANNSGRKVTVTDAGNVVLADAIDFDLDHINDTIELIFDQAVGKWLELSRSSNTAP